MMRLCARSLRVLGEECSERGGVLGEVLKEGC